ncbi:MAG: NUDIX domain-containing protein [Planctomycetota bacterium]
MAPPYGLDNARHCVHCAGPLQPKRMHGDHMDRLVCVGCGWILYRGPDVASGTVTIHEGKIVLVRRAVEPSKGLWTFPCGFTEREETLEEGAVRETLEECGLEVRLEGLLGAFSYPPDESAGGRVVVVAYAATSIGGTLVAGDDADDVMLVTRDEIPWEALSFASTRDALRAFLERQR